MEGNALIHELDGLAQKLGLSDNDIAVLCGLSHHTVRLARATRRAPRHARCRRRIASFLELNATANRRGELRLVDAELAA